MLPNERIAEKAYISGFSVPVKSAAPADKLQDWEMGGTFIQVPDDGLLVKLWHLKAVFNADLDTVEVILEAPGGVTPSDASVVLFSGPEITEVALAFDQNMNPFVAYIDGTDAKIYWYDPLESDMVHTTLPSGCYDLRACLDEHREFALADSDILLSYINGGNLCIRYQRERYEDEHILKAGVGGEAHLIYMQRNKGFRVQWRLRGAVVEDGSAITLTEPILGDVVFDLCRQAGIQPHNIDTSELYDLTTDIVPGMKVAIDEGLDQPIEWLREIYQFDKSQYDRKLHFPKRGRAVAGRIPYNELIVTGNKQALLQERIDEKKLPKILNINHLDSTGGFAKNKQTVGRRSNLIETDKEETINTQVVLTPDQALNAALVIIKSKYNEQYTYKFTTTIRHGEYTTGDVVEVEDAKGFWHRVRIEERNADGVNIDWEAKQDAGELAYVMHDAAGNVLRPPVSTTPGLVGDTQLEILNISIQRDQDDELGLYIAARGASSGWNGYVLYFSVDEGDSYTEAFSSTTASNIGETATSITDVGTAVEVLMPYPLESYTSAQIAAGYGRYVIGDEEIQAQTATLLGMVDGMYHYNMTGLVRGILHMPKEPWAAGIRFVQIDESVLFVQVQRELYQTDIWYKAVSSGQSADEVDPIAFMFDPAVNQTEWPVTNVEVVAAEGGGITVSWDGSPRLGTFGSSPFHSKHMIGYQVKFEDDHIIETTAETVTYPAGLLGTVVEVRARNAITGLGPLADGTGSVDPGDTPVFGFLGSFPDMYEGQSVYLWNGDNGIDMAGGYWDANARGFVVPGVGAKCSGSQLSGTVFVGIPFAAGTYTSKVRLDASSPDPAGSGTSDVSQSVTVLPTPTHGLLDLRFREYQILKTTLVDTNPPWKKFEVNQGGASLWFPGVTSGQVVGQLILDGANPDSVLFGIDNTKGELGIGGPTNVGISEFSPAATYIGDGTYSLELDADTGDWWLYKDGTGLIASGNLPLSPGNQYRICLSSEDDQVFTAEFNGGNETWFMAVTQVGFGGIPVPARDIPLAWASCEPDYILSFNGSGEDGAVYADDFAGGPSSLAKANAEYASGRHRFRVDGAVSAGICVAAFDLTHGKLGSPGSPNSAGMDGNVLRWCFGGTDGSITLPAFNLTYPNPILALDADGNTLKVCYQDNFGDVVVVHTLAIPSGETWQIAAWIVNGTFLTSRLPGPVGYDDAVVP